MPPRPSPLLEALALAGSFGAVTSVAGVGGLATVRGMRWYRGLDKPAFTPPDAVFGPVWGVLYASQAVAAWLVWRGDYRRDEVDVPALTSYGAQLALNLSWPLLFFGLRRPFLALVAIAMLWLAIVVTIREFSRRHKFAAALLLPYLAWVGYATFLTAALWWRNR